MTSSSTGAAFGNLTAFIDQGSEFEGKLSFRDTVRIDGTFTGEISSENTLIVGESGKIHATIKSVCVMVSGHVDGIGSVASFEPVGESWELRISAPPALARFLAYKGSITVNGVSLTVNRVVDLPESCEFSINLIPHTIENTTLGQLRAGHRVNLEIDLIARYVERMLGGSLPRH